MANATNTLYIYKTNFDPTRNLVIEDLDETLAGMTPVYQDNDFQYVDPALETTIKITVKSSDYDVALLKNGNFVKISEQPNGSSYPVDFYYFIMGAEWVADKTVRLTLALDTLNTFWSDITTNINDRTHITRQHKDRFKEESSARELDYPVSGTSEIRLISQNVYGATVNLYSDEWLGATVDDVVLDINNANITLTSFSLSDGWLTLSFRASSSELNVNFSYNGTATMIYPLVCSRQIDNFSEGLSPVVFGEQLAVLDDTEDNEESNRWYLVYKDTGVYACPKYPEEVTVDGKQTYTYSDLTSGLYYYFIEEANGTTNHLTATFTTDNGTVYKEELYQGSNIFGTYFKTVVVLHRNGSNIEVRLIKKQRLADLKWYQYNSSDWETCTSVTINAEESLVAHTLNSYTSTLTTIYNGGTAAFTLTPTSQTIASVDNIDRTDTTLVKIIELPYPPLETVGSVGWSYDNSTSMLQATFDTSFESRITNDTNPFSELLVTLNPSTTDAHDAVNESKLYHSDFYQPKFVYDSFSKTFALERENLDNIDIIANQPFQFTFKATNTINSRFLFDFTQYDTTGKSLEDYENILVVNRNNELPIYTSQYFEYLRAGYNYDIKAKQIQAGAAAGSAAVSLAGSAAAVGIAAAGIGGGSSAGPIGIAVGAAVGLVGAIVSIASANQLAANSIEQKEKQYAQQAISVRGADDIDLLNYYTDNKAKLMLYKPSEQMEAALYNLFRLTGYACDEYAIPDFDSRYWYNFVQCEPQFNVNNSAIYNDFLDDIKARFKLGVTVFHIHGSTYDLDQQYENWETSIL